MSKESLPGDTKSLQEELDKVKSDLKALNQKYIQHLKETCKVCNEDCVLWSLVWICHHKLREYHCARHLEKMITTTYAEGQYGIINKGLRCEYFMYILMTCKIAWPFKEFHFGKNDDECRDKRIHEAWQELISADTKGDVLMVILQYLKADRLGHCVVCDLTRRNEGKLEYHDLQQDGHGEVNKKIFFENVETIKGIKLFTVNIDNLKEIIDAHQERAVYDTEHAACVPNSLPAIPITKHVACDINSAACHSERGELVQVKKWLFSRCHKKNSVVYTMLWICREKLGVDLCGGRLESIITAYACAKFEKEALKCDQFIKLLHRCNLVTLVHWCEYPAEMNAKVQVIDQAWNTLVTTDGSFCVVILVRVISVAEGKGHAEVCDLASRTDGKVTILDPQNDLLREANQEHFRNHLIKDEGLLLYHVNLQDLKEIFENYRDI